MAFREDDGHNTLVKFGGDNFNLYKIKLEMALSTKDLWEIVEGTELPPPSTASGNTRRRMSGDTIRPLPSLPRAWWTRSWHISKDVKDRRKRRRPCVTSTRPKTYPTSCS